MFEFLKKLFPPAVSYPREKITTYFREDRNGMREYCAMIEQIDGAWCALGKVVEEKHWDNPGSAFGYSYVSEWDALSKARIEFEENKINAEERKIRGEKVFYQNHQ